MLKSQLCFSNSHPVCAVDVVFSHPEAEYCVMTMKYLNKLYEHKFIKVHHYNLVFTVSLYCTYSENICVFGRICLERECCAFSLLRSWFCFAIHSKKNFCVSVLKLVFPSSDGGLASCALYKPKLFFGCRFLGT
jgi:hypothetical protein